MFTKEPKRLARLPKPMWLSHGRVDWRRLRRLATRGRFRCFGDRPVTLRGACAVSCSGKAASRLLRFKEAAPAAEEILATKAIGAAVSHCTGFPDGHWSHTRPFILVEASGGQ